MRRTGGITYPAVSQAVVHLEQRRQRDLDRRGLAAKARAPLSHVQT